MITLDEEKLNLATEIIKSTLKSNSSIEVNFPGVLDIDSIDVIKLKVTGKKDFFNKNTWFTAMFNAKLIVNDAVNDAQLDMVFRFTKSGLKYDKENHMLKAGPETVSIKVIGFVGYTHMTKEVTE